jgi:Asp-tRNA(Asn)/Glu-tRNA(Gln) amidotransferase A subunit family amidase
LATSGLDLLAYPSMRRGPALLGDAQSGGNGLLAAVTGLPALSVPIGFTASGIPVGLELLGPPGSEERLLRAGAGLARALRPGLNPRPRPSLPG